MLRGLRQWAGPQIGSDLKIDDGTLDLAAQGIDVAIRFGEFAERAGLLATRLGSFLWVLVATRRYLEALGASETIADLVRHHRSATAIQQPAG